MTTACMGYSEGSNCLFLALSHLHTSKDGHAHLLLGFIQVLWHGIHSLVVGHGYGILDMVLVLHGKEVNGTDMSTSGTPTHVHIFINPTSHMALCVI